MADDALRAAERARAAAAPLDVEAHDRQVTELLRAGRLAEARAAVLTWLDAVHSRCDALLDRGERRPGSVDHDEVDRLLAHADAAIAQERAIRPRVLAALPAGGCLCSGPGYMPHEQRSAGCHLAPRLCGRRTDRTRLGADGRRYAEACNLGAGHRSPCRFLGLVAP